MAEITRDTSFKPVAPVHSHSYVDVEDDANEIFAGAFVQRTATGRVVIVNDTGGLGIGPIVGVNERNIPDQLGKTYSGPLERPTAKVYQGLYERPIDSTTPVTDEDMFETVYAANNHDVTSDPTKPVLGTMVGINNDAGTCTVLISGASNVALSALGSATLPLPLTSWFLETGVPLAAWADALDDPTPGLVQSLNANTAGIRYNDADAHDTIVTTVSIPDDADTDADMTFVLTAAKIGATADDTPTFLIGAYFQQPGVAHDADANAGGSTAAMTNPATKTVQRLTLTIDAADIPDTSGTSLSLTLVPETGELTTDDLLLISTRLEYTPKI